MNCSTYVEYIMQNAGLDEAQTENKISERNINNLRYIDDITPMAEIKEELKSLDEIERVWLNAQHSEN